MAVTDVPDFTVHGEGAMTTVFLLCPNTEAARSWCAQNLPEDAPTLGPNFAVDHGYVHAIVQGIVNDGLTVE